MSRTVDKAKLKRFAVTEKEAERLEGRINQALAHGSPEGAWSALCSEVLSPQLPFALHQWLYQMLALERDPCLGPLPAWFPPDRRHSAANLYLLMDRAGCDSYEAFYRWSIKSPGDYWRLMIRMLGIAFIREPDRVLDRSQALHRVRWLPGARMNITASCFNAPSDQPAVIYRESEDGPSKTMTYGELDRYSNRVANGLREAGYEPGDAIAVDMAMTVDAVAIYLGIVKAGCTVISIADSFSAPEIAARLRIAEARGIFTVDYITRGAKRLAMYEKVVSAGAPRAVVISSTPDFSLRPGDLNWSDFLSLREDFEIQARAPSDPINILFSSGTTGDPKAIPWDHTTPIKCAADGFAHQDIRPGDRVAWPTNLGWMMGPWLIFASLINQAAMVLYHDAPVGRGFCRFIRDAQVTLLGVVPSLVKAWRQNDAIRDLDWSSIRLFSSTGECSNQNDMLFLMSRAGYKPVIEYCGGTEIGGGYLTGSLLQPAVPATFSTPALGLELFLLDEHGTPADLGEVFLVPPSIGLSLELLNKDHEEVYFRGVPRGPDGKILRRHGDHLQRLPNGYYRALGRADDTMNLGGIKVSSAEIERVLKSVADIDESAAIALSPPGGGPSRLVVYVVLLGGRNQVSSQLETQLQMALRAGLNPLFKIEEVRVLPSLPRTASGKIKRRTLRQWYAEGSKSRPG